MAWVRPSLRNDPLVRAFHIHGSTIHLDRRDCGRPDDHRRVRVDLDTPNDIRGGRESNGVPQRLGVHGASDSQRHGNAGPERNPNPERDRNSQLHPVPADCRLHVRTIGSDR